MLKTRCEGSMDALSVEGVREWSYLLGSQHVDMAAARDVVPGENSQDFRLLIVNNCKICCRGREDRCYECGNRGHFARDCRRRGRRR